MSYSMGSIDCLAVKINNEYFEALKRDIQLFKENKLNITDEVQLGLLKNWVDEEFDSVDDLINIDDDIRYYDGGKHSQNYAYQTPIDLKTGTLGYGDNFDGYVYEISWGSSSIYKPEFKDKEDLIYGIKQVMYVPTTFKLENNVIFLTGVWGG